MAQCPLCGSQSLVTQGNVVICESCGAQFSGADAAALMGGGAAYGQQAQQYGAPQGQYGAQQGYGMPQGQQYDVQRGMPPQQGMPPQGMPQQGYGMPQQGYGQNQQYGAMPPQGMPPQGMPQQGYGAPQQGYGAPQQGYGMPQQGMPQQQAYGNQQYGQQGYGMPQQDAYDQNLGNLQGLAAGIGQAFGLDPRQGTQQLNQQYAQQGMYGGTSMGTVGAQHGLYGMNQAAGTMNVGYGMENVATINNRVCMQARRLIDDYRRIDHPTKARQQALGRQMAEQLSLLEQASTMAPDNPMINIIILENADRLMDMATRTQYYEKNSEGKWQSHSFGLRESDIRGSATVDSYEKMAKYYRNNLVSQWLQFNPQAEQQRAALEQQKAGLNAQLDELKAEKKGKGFFNFAEKGEVKSRMKPLQNQVAEINKQISAIEHQADRWIEEQLNACAMQTGIQRLNSSFR